MSSAPLRLLTPLVLAAMPLAAQVHEAEPPVDLARGLIFPPSAQEPVGRNSFAVALLAAFPANPSETVIASQGDTTRGWRFLVAADGTLRFEARVPGKQDAINVTTVPGVIAPGTKHHFALNILRDAAKPNAGIWVDGVELASGVVPPVDLTAPQPFAPAADATHVRLYHRELSRPEILALQLDALGNGKPVARHPDPPPNGPRFIPQPGETIALIGGTEAVALAESGELEALLLMAFPQTRFHFRSLAWEGDTVFRQDRPMNFGSLEQQLRRVNAGAVFVMFGRQECLEAGSREQRAGNENAPPRSGDLQSPIETSTAKPQDSEASAVTTKNGASPKVDDGDFKSPLLVGNTASDLAEFEEAFGKLLDTVARVTPNIVVIGPMPFETKEPPLPDLSKVDLKLWSYLDAMKKVASRIPPATFFHARDMILIQPGLATTDGNNLSPRGRKVFAQRIVMQVVGMDQSRGAEAEPMQRLKECLTNAWSRSTDPAQTSLFDLLHSKNRLWHDYWRPSNWAFLHGDRTQQPSSRDPVNPQVRLFPAEQEKYLPLIKAAEERIYKLVEEATKKLP